MDGFIASLKFLTVFDFAWLVPCIVGAFGLLIVAVTLLWQEFNWQKTVTTALFVAICGASVIAKINLSKDGSFTIETRDAVGNIFGRFEEIAKTNTDAIEQIKETIVQLNAEVAKVRVAAVQGANPSTAIPNATPPIAPAPVAPTLAPTIRKLEVDVLRSVESNTRKLNEINALRKGLKPF